MMNFLGLLKKRVGHSFNVFGPGQIGSDLNAQELETLEHFCFSTINANWGMWSTMVLEVNN